jgi:NTP pyrophosphatase (non-canonical NTP hydrolase)
VNVRTFAAYHALSRRTISITDPATHADEVLTLGALGLAGETGEIVDIIKKVRFHGRTLDEPMPKHPERSHRAAIVEEAGDVLWYLARILEGVDSTLGEAAALNIAKLDDRYPAGFSAEASRAHRDERPRLSLWAEEDR